MECFHKASLIHDDIEDDDRARYGEPTLHMEHGTAVALNVGDLLVGEGYRLLAECESVHASVRGEMIKIASAGHRTLCLGQGAELSWAHAPAPLTPLQVVEIFRRKTAPAFEVALRLGAALADADDDVHRTLTKYSEALGIAYQIKDDLEDLDAGHAGDDVRALRPSLPLAIAFERAKGDQKLLLEQIWRRDRDRRGDVRGSAPHRHGDWRGGALPRAARRVQGAGHPRAARVGGGEPQGPAAPRDRQGLQRGDQRMVS